MSNLGAYTGVAVNAGRNTNTMPYLEEGSGTGSFVGAELDPNEISVNNYTSDSDSSVNPAEQYLSHDLTVTNMPTEPVNPDPADLAEYATYGHFADHFARTHCAVEETGGWGPAVSEEDLGTSDAEAHAMCEL